MNKQVDLTPGTTRFDTGRFFKYNWHGNTSPSPLQIYPLRYPKRRFKDLLADFLACRSLSWRSPGQCHWPLLFLLYIICLSNHVKPSSTSIFADDSMISRTIRNKKDAFTASKDLINPTQWESRWKKMNPAPINVKQYQYQAKKKNIKTIYSIYRNTLKHVKIFVV